MEIPKQLEVFKISALCKEFMKAYDMPSRILVLAQLKELAFVDSYVQHQVIKEGCIPTLIASMETGEMEEKALAAGVIMRIALLGSLEIVKAGGLPPLISMLSSGFEQTVAIAVQAIWVLLLERKNHEVVVSLGGMQVLMSVVKQSGVLDVVKDLAAQALFCLWSEDAFDGVGESPKSQDKCLCLYNRATIKLMNHGSACLNGESYTIQPALLNIFWLVHHVNDDVIQGMIRSPRVNILLSQLPPLALLGDTKIQEKIQFCSQYALPSEIEFLRKELNLARMEILAKDKSLREQVELQVKFQQQMVEHKVVLSDIIRTEELRLAEENKKDEEIQQLNTRIAELEKINGETTTKLQRETKKHNETKQKVKKAEEKWKQIEKIMETAVNEHTELLAKVERLEQNEKQLQSQLLQNKCILLQQSKKLQQMCGVAPPISPPEMTKLHLSPAKKETDLGSDKNDSLVCPICLEKTKNVAFDGCGHTLCKGCAAMIISTSNKKCPICRKNVKAANPFYL